jgi:RNA polymerase sigma-70 factor, ECF subfamily
MSIESSSSKSLSPEAMVVEDEKVIAWFYRVRNSVIDHYRHRSASRRALETWGRDFTESQEPEAGLRQEICQCISGMLTDLKPEYREALRVVDLEDGKLGDLAEQSEITVENAAVRVHRARRALRRKVEQACGTCAEHGCFDCHCKPASGSHCGEQTPA